MFKRKFLRKSFNGRIDKADALARTVRVAADGDDPQGPRPRRIDHLLRAIMIGRDHRRAARRDEIAEQPQLGGEVMRDIGMIVHVIAREIGEAAGGDAHAVQAVLIKAVR